MGSSAACPMRTLAMPIEPETSTWQLQQASPKAVGAEHLRWTRKNFNPWRKVRGVRGVRGTRGMWGARGKGRVWHVGCAGQGACVACGVREARGVCGMWSARGKGRVQPRPVFVCVRASTNATQKWAQRKMNSSLWHICCLHGVLAVAHMLPAWGTGCWAC